MRGDCRDVTYTLLESQELDRHPTSLIPFRGVPGRFLSVKFLESYGIGSSRDVRERLLSLNLPDELCCVTSTIVVIPPLNSRFVGHSNLFRILFWVARSNDDRRRASLDAWTRASSASLPPPQDASLDSINHSVTSQNPVTTNIYQYRNKLIANARTTGKHLNRVHPVLGLAYGPLQSPDGMYASQHEKDIWEGQSDSEWDGWEGAFGGTHAIREQCEQDASSEIGTAALSQELSEQQEAVRSESPSFMFKVVSRARSRSIAAIAPTVQNSTIEVASVPVPIIPPPIDRQSPRTFSILSAGPKSPRARSATTSWRPTAPRF